MTDERLKQIEERRDCWREWKKLQTTKQYVAACDIVENDVQELVAEIKKLQSEKEVWGNEFTAVHTVKLENYSLHEVNTRLQEVVDRQKEYVEHMLDLRILLRECRPWIAESYSNAEIIKRIDVALGKR